MAYSGIWLAILDRDQLHEIGRIRYGKEGFYRTDEYNSRGLWGWEAKAIDRDFGGCRRLLVLAAGGGREVHALRGRGFEVHGVESDPGLAQYANGFLERAGLAPDIRVVPWDQPPDASGRYDGVVIGWGGYTHIRGRDVRVRLLRQLRALVPPGAPLLLSFYTTREGHELFRGIARIGNGLARILRNPGVEVGDSLVPNYTHFFTEEQIRSELAEGGFEMTLFELMEYGHAVGRAV